MPEKQRRSSTATSTPNDLTPPQPPTARRRPLYTIYCCTSSTCLRRPNTNLMSTFVVDHSVGRKRLLLQSVFLLLLLLPSTHIAGCSGCVPLCTWMRLFSVQQHLLRLSYLVLIAAVAAVAGFEALLSRMFVRLPLPFSALLQHGLQLACVQSFSVDLMCCCCPFLRFTRKPRDSCCKFVKGIEFVIRFSCYYLFGHANTHVLSWIFHAAWRCSVTSNSVTMLLRSLLLFDFHLFLSSGIFKGSILEF